MKKFLSVFLFVYVPFLLAQEHKGVNPEEALKKLMDGNARYVSSNYTHPNQSSARREEVAKGQRPFAIIVTCSDSRVPPEILFDQGLGDLFVIRVAGNIVDDHALGSIEYAAEHLGVELVVVLGHERCGAVDATVKGGEAPGHIASLVKAIKPAVDKAKKENGDLLENSIKNNVLAVTKIIATSKPILEEMVKKRHIKVVSARYDLDDGKVELYK
ncbi:MAG: carbonic anhydrase [Flavobacterium sp.]|nr:carbonic anhydrase [Flavobacterium sp.]